jgi:hypothetical protein
MRLRHLDEPVGTKRVEADVDSVEPGAVQVIGEGGTWRRWSSPTAQGPGRRTSISTDGVRAAANFSTRTGRWARTVGSPPVKRKPSTSKCSTKMRQTLDLLERQDLAKRSHTMPSSGMQ